MEIDQTQPPVAQDEEREVSYDEAFAIARQLHKEQRLDEAEVIYGMLLEAVPEHADLLSVMSILTYQKGDLDKSEEYIRRAVVAAPGHADYRNNLGNILVNNGRHAEAVVAYRESVELNPQQGDAYNNIGLCLRVEGKLDESVEAFHKGLEFAPELIELYFNLGNTYLQMGLLEDAVEFLRKTLTLNEQYLDAYKSLGRALIALGQNSEAEAVYNALLKYNPKHPLAMHMLAVLHREETPARASDDYVRGMFDRFSDNFDKQLSRLRYQAPQICCEALQRHSSAKGKCLDILDAGCGTGLCGPLLAPVARRLVGVDLSPGMLSKATDRGYDQLEEAELTDYLGKLDSAFDAIVSADTLVYFGALEELVSAAFRALRAAGYLVFTLESATECPAEGYNLTDTGRFSHHREYLERVMVDAGFEVDELQDIHLRIEGGVPVNGFLLVAHKPITG